MRCERVLTIVLMTVLAACAEPKVTSLLAPGACRAVILVDADRGTVVRGAEDLAFDPATGMVYVAAIDRWALETAVRRGARALVQGAVYAIPFSKLVTADRLTVTDKVQAFTTNEAFHPHGIGLLRAEGQPWLAVVNRRFRRRGDTERVTWRAEPAVELFVLTSAGLVHRRTVTHSSLCRPNDVALLSATRLLVTNDHGCDRWPDWLEDILGLAHANVVALDLTENGAAVGTVIANGIAFANGITAAANDVLYVAATRERAVHAYRWSEADSGRASVLGKIALPGGPDNITQSADGRLFIAVHPSLLELGRYRHRWLAPAHASSRLVAVTPEKGRARVYLDDPNGHIISAATAVLAHDGWLVFGSVTDAGLGVCPDPGSPGAVQPDRIIHR